MNRTRGSRRWPGSAESPGAASRGNGEAAELPAESHLPLLEEAGDAVAGLAEGAGKGGGPAELRALRDELGRSRSLAEIGEAVASIAHEIKNPLAAISAPLQILRDRSSTDEETRDILREVIAQVTRLDGIVHHLLLLSRPWIPEKAWRSLREVAEKVAEATREHPAFKAAVVVLEGPRELHALVDAALLEQVLWNLMLNAAEATSGEGEIRVRVRGVPGRALLSVSDRGPGIPPEVQAKLFRPFFTTKAGGNGLGLATCRKIMDAHGGTLSLTSRAGEGASVTIGFPR